jgi:uncharacterized membrane protein YhhN
MVQGTGVGGSRTGGVKYARLTLAGASSTVEVGRREFPGLHRILGETCLLGGGVLLWKIGRGLVEGAPQAAVANARGWHGFEADVHVDVEARAIRAAHGVGGDAFLRTAYAWLHYPGLALFLASALVFAPTRFAQLRTTFLLGHVPALLLIGFMPVAPPRWLPELPYSEGIPSAGELAGQGRLANETATLVGFHFGYAAFVAAGTIWLVRGRLRYAVLAYPVFVLIVVLGTGNHYLLDNLVGPLCFVIGMLGARALQAATGAPTRPVLDAP